MSQNSEYAGNSIKFRACADIDDEGVNAVNMLYLSDILSDTRMINNVPPPKDHIPAPEYDNG